MLVVSVIALHSILSRPLLVSSACRLHLLAPSHTYGVALRCDVTPPQDRRRSTPLARVLRRSLECTRAVVVVWNGVPQSCMWAISV